VGYEKCQELNDSWEEEVGVPWRLPGRWHCRHFCMSACTRNGERLLRLRVRPCVECCVLCECVV
jgi:hypothetical protein